jgi:hypothetical protein
MDNFLEATRYQLSNYKAKVYPKPRRSNTHCEADLSFLPFWCIITID